MKDFLYGTATSAYQIEGGANEDGRANSIWDVFSRNKGNIYGDNNGDITCDHYHKMEEDVLLMKSLGMQAYRFSVSWSRVLPKGTGEVNEKGLQFYDRLIGKLIENNIVPCLTLYHWDLPQSLQEKGGWENCESIEWFLKYAELIFKRYRDTVPYYITFNEITTFSNLGYGNGIFAPGVKDEKRRLKACHNVLLAHGEAVKLFRKLKIDSEIGIAIDIWPRFPKDLKDFEFAEKENALNHFWVYDAVIFGQYPIAAVNEYENKNVMPKILPQDMEIISQKLDFFGLNYYSSEIVTQKDGKLINIEYTDEKTDFGWKVCADGFYALLIRISRETRLPILITENGMADNDNIINGEINDNKRIDFLKAHFQSVERANNNGANILGFMVWSFMDNFEWAAGYSKRFGLVYVDYATQKRIPKKSALWYKNYIKEHSLKF